jgi:uroporphyrinogen decarboxylase
MTSTSVTPTTAKPAHLLLRAARGEAVERPPVWAMRQAGRWDPEFNKVRSGMPFFEFSADVERSAQASLCPRRFGVDGIILFYDITTLPFSMGLPFELKPQQGPVPDRPIRTKADLERLNPDPDPQSYRHIIDLLQRVKAELRGELPVLVFAGAPFTVAAYCIGTGKHMDQTRRFAKDQPDVWRGLLDRLSHATIGFLNTLIREGAELYQLFDSWAGELTLPEYDEWAQPYHREILAGATGVPRVIFVKESPYLERLTASGADIVSLGRRHDLAAARRDYPDLVFQGNVDEEVLARGGRAEVIAATKACLQEGGGQRHIVNLNHGCDKSTPVENFEAYVRTVRGG